MFFFFFFKETIFKKKNLKGLGYYKILTIVILEILEKKERYNFDFNIIIYSDHLEFLILTPSQRNIHNYAITV